MSKRDIKTRLTITLNKMEWICKNIIKLQCSCFGYIDQEEADDLLIHENENESEKSRLGLSIFDQAEMIKMVFDELKEENQTKRVRFLILVRQKLLQ